MLCRCWLGGRKGIRPVKTEWWGAGVDIYLERGANLHTTQLMPLPFTVSCFSKIQIGFTFLVPPHPGSPGQRALKRVCVMTSRPHRRVLPLVSHFEYIDHRAWDPGFYQIHGFFGPYTSLSETATGSVHPFWQCSPIFPTTDRDGQTHRLRYICSSAQCFDTA